MERLRDDATLTIRIAGDGGEGVLLAGELCAEMLARVPELVLLHKSPARAWGAPASVQLRVSDRPILAPGDSLDILFAWTQEAYDRYRDSLFSEGLLLYDPERVRPRESDAPIRNGLPLSRLSSEHPIERAKGYVAAGVLARLLQLPKAASDAVLASVPDDGRLAFEDGYERARRPPLGVLHYDLAPWRGPARTPTTGADAVAGAFAKAGVRIAVCVSDRCPPSIRAALARAKVELREAASDGVASEQVRALAAPVALVSAEGLHGLAALAQALRGTSVVLLRTPPEDGVCAAGDLESILAAGTPAVFAPASVAECGSETKRAVNAALAAGQPVALYLDPVLGDCLSSVDAGEGETVVRLDAAEAHFRELESRELESRALESSARPSRPNEASSAVERVGVIAWGAMEGAVREALLNLVDRGVAVDHLHLRTLAPLDTARCRSFLAPLTRVIVADPEPSGPVAAVLEHEFHVSPERIYWPAGTPLSPATVIDAILGG